MSKDKASTNKVALDLRSQDSGAGQPEGGKLATTEQRPDGMLEGKAGDYVFRLAQPTSGILYTSRGAEAVRVNMSLDVVGDLPVATSDELQALYHQGPEFADLVIAPDDYPDRWPEAERLSAAGNDAGCSSC